MNREKQRLLFVVPYNPILGSKGPQGPKNVSQPLIELVSNAYDMVLIVVSDDIRLTENTLRVAFPALLHVHIVRPLTGWARQSARIRFALQGLPPALADGLSQELPTLLRKYAVSSELVHFEYFTLAASIQLVEPFCKVQLHCHDAYSLYQRRLLQQAESVTEKLVARLRSRLFLNLERRLFSKATAALTVSPIDQQYLACRGLTNVHYLPPAVQDINISIPLERQYLRVELLCIVSTKYQRSQAIALGVFFREKFPLLVRQVGGAIPVTLLGKSARRLQTELLPYLDVEAVEYVDDYLSFLSSRNWICFYPQRAGAGLHTKLRDIMAAQLPIVGYTEIMDAFSGTSGKHYFSCDNDEQVADSISSLLSNPALHAEVAKGGYRLLSEQFGPARVLDAWDKLNGKVGRTEAREVRPSAKVIDLLRLQECQLSLSLQVRQICEKHDIPYFLIAGTLLGAARHGGFIPWDDDLDIGMLRQNYERFIALAQTELGDAYFVQTYGTDQYMPFPYAKLRINGTIMRERASRNCKWNNGISIDIFPFDGVPECSPLQFIHRWSLKAVSLLLMVKCEFNPINDQTSLIRMTVFKGVRVPVRWLLPRWLLVFILELLTRFFSGKATRLVMASGGSYGYKRETIPRSWVEESTPMVFCNEKFSCPSFWKDYLVNLYGDFMKLPPIDSRFNRHGIIELKFLDLK